MSRSYLTENPEDLYHIQHISSSVSQQLKSATIYMDAILEGGTSGATVCIMTVSKWVKNQEGRWLRHKFRSMRNMALP
jgi:hypothetical protein